MTNKQIRRILETSMVHLEDEDISTHFEIYHNTPNGVVSDGVQYWSMKEVPPLSTNSYIAQFAKIMGCIYEIATYNHKGVRI